MKCHHCGQKITLVIDQYGVENRHAKTGRARGPQPAKDENGKVQRHTRGHLAEPPSAVVPVQA